MEQQDTITALATPKGKSALAVIRISGKNAIATAARCVYEKEKLTSCPPGTINLYTFASIEKAQIIDQITALTYRSPKSYTGEDMVEILCHGGTAVVDEILKTLIDAGARYALHGEFTKRAFLNNKVSILKAEAINEIIDSKNEKQLHNAIKSYRGEYEEVFKKLKTELENALTMLEAKIEFPEEDSVYETKELKKTIKQLGEIKHYIAAELNKREKSVSVEKGLEVAIIGKQNTGKSSLFNVLLQRDRSLVHHKSGTTRDFVTENCLIEGMYVTIIDTAGIGQTNNEVEKMGIERSWKYVEKAPVVIWVTSTDQPLSGKEKKIVEKRKNDAPIIAVINKIDINKGVLKKQYCEIKKVPFISSCLLKNEDKEKVRSFVSENIKKVYQQYAKESIIHNKRQETSLKHLVDILKEIEKGKQQEEILVFHLKEALKIMEEFVGVPTSEEILNKIFNSFCIGK